MIPLPYAIAALVSLSIVAALLGVAIVNARSWFARWARRPTDMERMTDNIRRAFTDATAPIDHSLASLHRKVDGLRAPRKKDDAP